MPTRTRTHRVLAAAAGFGLVACLAVLLTSEDAAVPPASASASPQVAARPDPEPALTDPLPQEPAAPARAKSAVRFDWRAGATEPAPEPIELAADERPAYRGQLVWQHTLRPVARVQLRLTRAWLDTVLPNPAEDTRRFANGEPLELGFAGQTDDLGRFALPFVADAGDLFLRIDPGGPAEDLRMLRLPFARRSVDLGVIEIEERGRVAGSRTTIQVFDVAGAPAVGAEVTVRPVAAAWPEQQVSGEWHLLREEPIRLGTTDADGELIVDGLWDTWFDLAASHPRLGAAQTRVSVEKPGQGFVLSLRPPAPTGHIEGTLVEAGRAPATRWWVHARRRNDVRTVRTDDDGRFRFRDLPAGSWYLGALARAPDTERPFASDAPRLEVFVAGGATTPLLYETSFRRDALRGRVLLNGFLADDLTVVVERVTAGNAQAKSWDRPFRATARVDAEGRFSVRLGYGDQQLSVVRQHRGQARTLAIQRLDGRSHGDEELHLDLAVGTADLQVLAPDGRLVVDTALAARLLGSDPPIGYDVVSDAHGQVYLEDIPRGDYELAAPNTDQRARFTVIARQITPCSVTLGR